MRNLLAAEPSVGKISSFVLLLVFLAIVVFYSWAMARFERRDALATDPGPPPLEDGADDAAL